MRCSRRSVIRSDRAIAAVMTLVIAWPNPASAAVHLSIASVFSDFAVLQRDRPIMIWGRGEAGARIVAALGSDHATTDVDRAGDWRLSLLPRPASDEVDLTLSASTGERLALRHLAIGDVWLCSGQSNMEFPVRAAADAEAELAQSSDELLRLLLVPRQRTPSPSSTFSQPASWQASNPGSAAAFSAACYFMGRELRRSAHVPIGLVSSAWGGSRIEDWLSAARLKRLGGFDTELAQLAAHATDPVAANAAAATRLTAWLTAFADRPAPTHTIVRGNPEHGRWEEWGEPSLAKFDGIARYAATVTLTAQQACEARYLAIGQVDDIDLTRLNGHTVGSSVGWDQTRRYDLTAQPVKTGRNLVDIVVLDTGSGGGLWGSEPRGVVLANGRIVPFDRDWTLQPIATLAETGSPPLVPWANGEGLATLHNGMIAPLGPYAIKGFAWYQGESNADRAAAYPPLLRALIGDWRAQFGGGPFMIVQLAGYGAMTQGPVASNWAILREAQRQVAVSDPAVLLVPAIDIGDVYNLHPTNKRELGRRLALAALDKHWIVGTIVPSIQGSAATIDLGRSYHLVGGVAQPAGVEACDAGGRCRFITSRLDQPDRLRIELAATDVEIRYLWADSPLVSLFDDDGVPLPPFKYRLTR